MTSSGETSGSGDIVRTLELLWDGAPRPSRGPKPGLTLDRIVEVAVRIADEEGFDAVSMRRIATELGTGAMSLYRYVPGKAELLDLMLDRVQKPAENPADLGDGGWRAALEAVARATLALYTRHPWLLGVNQARPLLGPSALDGLEKVLGRIRPMGLTDPELVSAAIMIDGYVVGAARTQVYQQEAERNSGMTTSEFFAAQAPFLEKVMTAGRYPVLASLADDTWSPEFDHFEFGLQRILDGLEVCVEERRRQSESASGAAESSASGAAGSPASGGTAE
ncbi:TetR/AcrR family transcriptional regulator [Streptomyces sp. SID13726]|uniref:TetR/AcrR family transcriptional regulator n=1 Tax=Streptomyces sp. SID13726 TaxID=2706058 RepID=UPI0013BAFFC0|nr:TetR/AcrR family transcriptional regulator [Streptomyces sp. SID13726]NEB04984.1 TetR/AcrR family transcriptional regulator [Streptomyces sp. SID13726]